MSEQTPQPIDADDPGLTAYALGELDGAEAARYQAAVAASAELQAVVAEIHAEVSLLTNELAREPQIPITAERRDEIAAQAGKLQPVVATQRRFPWFSRRVAVVAASVALIPGAWYAFQAAFPRSQPAPVLAQQEPPASASGYYLGDDVQYFPDTPEVRSKIDAWHKQVDARRPKSDELGDLSTTSETFEQSEGVSSDPHGGKQHTRGVQVAKPSGPGSNLASLGYASGGAMKRPGPMVDGPGLMQKGLSVSSSASARPKGSGSGSERAGVPGEGKLSPVLTTPLPRSAESGLMPGGRKPGQGNAGGPRGERAPLAGGALPGGIRGREAGQPKGEPASDESGVDHPESQTAKLLLVDANKRAKPSKDTPFPAARPGSQPTKPGKKSPANELKALEDAEAVSDVTEELDAITGAKVKGDEKPLSVAKAPGQKGKPDTFDFTDEPLLGVPQHILEREAESKRLEKLKQTDPTTDEAYNPIYENAFITPQEQQLSTFSIDVDTASYANLRRFVQGGQLPPPDAVRIEELVNYFSYQYPQPQDGRPFSVQTDIAACPWQPGHQLVRIGLKGKEIPKEQRSPTNLVFLVDVSGSMSAPNKLPLVRESLKTLVNQLDERDKVAIVTYAGEAGVPLTSTSVAQKEVVLNAISGLGAGGSTNGAAGINTAYDIAAQEFLEKGTNRVILLTDGDFNVGVTRDDDLVKMIQTRAKGGVFLSVFGFGMGNLKDAKLEQLADKGNGQYGYIDDQQEANKVFVQELMGTLVTIAKDVKIQIDFNKDTVASYRLVGYENRIMAAEDFHDDKKDAGEIGAGHTVTALYQIVPIKDLKANAETRWLTVKLRYKQPDAATSVLMENPLVGQPGQLKLAPSDFQFAASVAACGMLLRHSQYAGQANWGLVKELAQSGLSYDPHGHRRAFIGLAAQAESLMGQFYPKAVPATDSTAGGKYKSLLRRVHAPEDAEKFGQFKDQGHSDKKAYAGAENLPEGYWVYAAPYWYIWAETTEK